MNIKRKGEEWLKGLNLTKSETEERGKEYQRILICFSFISGCLKLLRDCGEIKYLLNGKEVTIKKAIGYFDSKYTHYIIYYNSFNAYNSCKLARASYYKELIILLNRLLKYGKESVTIRYNGVRVCNIKEEILDLKRMLKNGT